MLFTARTSPNGGCRCRIGASFTLFEINLPLHKAVCFPINQQKKKQTFFPPVALPPRTQQSQNSIPLPPPQCLHWTPIWSLVLAANHEDVNPDATLNQASVALLVLVTKRDQWFTCVLFSLLLSIHVKKIKILFSVCTF